MKTLLYILLILLTATTVSAQSITRSGNTTQLAIQQGGFKPVRYLAPPNTFNPWATYDSLGMVWIDSTTTKKLMWHTGVYRRYVASERYVDSLFATAVTGVTQQTLDDSCAAIRADFPTGGDVTTAQLSDSIGVVRDSLTDHWAAIMARELLSNKVTSFASPDNTTYPTTSAVNSLVASYKLKGDSTANDGYVTHYQDDTAKAAIRAAIPSVTGYLPISDSITVYATQYGLDTGVQNTRIWAWGTFLTSFTETDPLSFHKADSNTAGEAVTYSYYWSNIPSVSGKVNYTDTATMLVPYLRKADSNFNGGYESYKHAAITYQPIGSYVVASATSVNTVPIVSGANNTITVPIATGVTGLGTGVATWAATPSSANLSAALTDEIGSGKAVFYPDDTTISAAYTLTSRDMFRTIHCTNGSNIALTIPTGLGTSFVCVVLAEGAGTVTPTASSTTFYYQPTSTTKIKSQGGATIRSWATANSYLIIGSLE